MGRQVFSHSWESRALWHIMLTWEDTHHYSKSLPSSSSSSPALYGEDCHVVWNVSLASFSQIFHLSPFPASCAAQSPPWWGGMRSRKGVDYVQALLSSNEKLPVLLTVASTNPKCSPIPPSTKKIIYHPKPAQIDINQRD